MVAIDGKTARRSYDRGKGKKELHLVSAWETEARLVLGQVAVEEKSNEITAIPELLELLQLEGCIVTIDAMGTQRAIAAQIIEQKGDYVLALEENQATCMRTSKIPFVWLRKSNFEALSPTFKKRLTRLMGVWKSANIGSLTIWSS